MWKLNTAETSVLLNQPETGMGYQRVVGTTSDNKTETGLVFNAELFFRDGESRKLLDEYSYQTVLKVAEAQRDKPEFKTLRAVETRENVFYNLRKDRFGKDAGPASTAAVEETGKGEVFKRFSAYQNDNRLRPDASWRPGTYATTAEDAKNVTTGMEAVARYALPNPEPASWVFTGRPHEGTKIQRGIVTPANGQPGGGVEVLFPEGTQPGTVTGPDKIPGK